MPNDQAQELPTFYDHEREHEDERVRRAPDWGGDELFATMPRRRFARAGARPPRGDHAAPAPTAVAERERVVEPETFPSRTVEPPPTGRRTVVVTGRPGHLVTARRRPPRTVDERLGARPERVAAWAFGLGLTLILIAVTTAEAAPV